MSEAVDLSSILSKPASDIEPPKPLPNGIYIAQIESYETGRKAGEKQTPCIDFNLKVLQPTDVDPSECELPKNIRHTLFVTEQSLFRLKDFLEGTLQIEGGHRTLAEMLPEARGRMLRVEVVQKAYTPRGATEPQMINNINKTFPLEG